MREIMKAKQAYGSMNSMHVEKIGDLPLDKASISLSCPWPRWVNLLSSRLR